MAKNTPNQASTQQYLSISEIHDNAVVLKDGSLRAVLAVSSLNFSLKKEEERDSIIYGYQSFLNYLDFNIQIVTQTRKVDLSDYLERMNQAVIKIENNLLQNQAYSYIDFISTLLKYANVMDKRFYVIIPQYSSFAQTSSSLIKKNKKGKTESLDTKTFTENVKELNQRVAVVTSLLGNIGLKCAQLNTEQLIEFYYNTYNPDTSQNQKLPPIEQVTNIGIVQKGVK